MQRVQKEIGHWRINGSLPIEHSFISNTSFGTQIVSLRERFGGTEVSREALQQQCLEAMEKAARCSIAYQQSHHHLQQASKINVENHAISRSLSSTPSFPCFSSDCIWDVSCKKSCPSLKIIKYVTIMMETLEIPWFTNSSLRQLLQIIPVERVPLEK